MRLIDACELNEIIDGNENLLNWQKEEMKLCVDACDTAYDVDEVIKTLQQETNDFNLKNVDNVYISRKEKDMYGNAIKKAIRIVKNGGVK